MTMTAALKVYCNLVKLFKLSLNSFCGTSLTVAVEIQFQKSSEEGALGTAGPVQVQVHADIKRQRNRRRKSQLHIFFTILFVIRLNMSHTYFKISNAATLKLLLQILKVKSKEWTFSNLQHPPPLSKALTKKKPTYCCTKINSRVVWFSLESSQCECVGQYDGKGLCWKRKCAFSLFLSPLLLYMQNIDLIPFYFCIQRCIGGKYPQ